MKVKMAVFVTALLFASLGMGQAQVGQQPSKRESLKMKSPLIKNQYPRIPPGVGLIKEEKGSLLSLCNNVGEYQCNMEGKSFRICESDKLWSRRTTLQGEEAEIMEKCMQECVPGEHVCLFPDSDYRACDENGHWWPGGSGWARIPDRDNPAEAAKIRQSCEENEQRHRNQQCTPGKYRCFNDGGYNRCGDSGSWSEAGSTSREFTTFLNHCAFPRH